MPQIIEPHKRPCLFAAPILQRQCLGAGHIRPKSPQEHHSRARETAGGDGLVVGTI